MKNKIKEEYCYPEHWIKEGRKQALEEIEKVIDDEMNKAVKFGFGYQVLHELKQKLLGGKDD